MNDIFIQATRTNMGLMSPDTWNNVRYEINHDGTCKITTTYGRGKNEKATVLEPEVGELDLIRLNNLCESIQKYVIQDNISTTCDGEIWNITAYNRGGDFIFKFRGYTQQMQPLEDITGILKQFATKE